MTAVDVAALREALAKGSRPPWSLDGPHRIRQGGEVAYPLMAVAWSADAALIVLLRNTAPALLDALAANEAEVVALRESLDAARADVARVRRVAISELPLLPPKTRTELGLNLRGHPAQDAIGNGVPS